MTSISPLKLNAYNFAVDCPTAAKFVFDHSSIKLPNVIPYPHHENKKQKFTVFDQELKDVDKGYFA